MKVGIDANRRAAELKLVMQADFRESVSADLDRITQQSRDVRGALSSYANECIARMFDYSAVLAAHLIMENNAAIAKQLRKAGLKMPE
ncbi:MAG: hypothetical protein WCL39_03435 [Armatimonadota bacterium]|jgi:hypothetical protein